MKYPLNKPEGLEKLDKNLPICQMFREAQDSNPFCAAKTSRVWKDSC
jgi:hypothetical protein